MTVIGLLIVICVVLFCLWLVQTYMPAPWKTPTLVVLVLLAVVFCIVTIFPGAANVRVR